MDDFIWKNLKVDISDCEFQKKEKGPLSRQVDHLFPNYYNGSTTVSFPGEHRETQSACEQLGQAVGDSFKLMVLYGLERYTRFGIWQFNVHDLVTSQAKISQMYL